MKFVTKGFRILHESAKSYGMRTVGTTPPADPPDRGAKHLREPARGAGPGTKSEPPATRESAAPAAAGKRGERPETEPSGESRRKGDGGRQAARKRTPGAAPEGDRSAAPANRSATTGRREKAPGQSETHQREDESRHHGRETGDSGERRTRMPGPQPPPEPLQREPERGQQTTEREGAYRREAGGSHLPGPPQLPATELPAGDTAARVNLARPRRANDTYRRVGGGWSVCCLHDDSQSVLP